MAVFADITFGRYLILFNFLYIQQIRYWWVFTYNYISTAFIFFCFWPFICCPYWYRFSFRFHFRSAPFQKPLFWTLWASVPSSSCLGSLHESASHQRAAHIRTLSLIALYPLRYRNPRRALLLFWAPYCRYGFRTSDTCTQPLLTSAYTRTHTNTHTHIGLHTYVYTAKHARTHSSTHVAIEHAIQ